MSTHRLISERQQSVSLTFCSTLCGLLIALQLWLALSFPAFAAARLAPHIAPPPDMPQDITRAGVSVVRLLVSYTDTDAPAAPVVVQCTGLGVIVSSWPARAGDDQNNWVLTDGTLVNKNNKATCASGSPAARLSTIWVFFSQSYNNRREIFFAANPASIQCSKPACSQGPALFALKNGPLIVQPFLDVSPISGAQSTGIMLTQENTSATIPLLPTAVVTHQPDISHYISQFLVPRRVSSTDTLEPGTPFVSPSGDLFAMHVSGASLVTRDTLQSFIKQAPANHAVNPVYEGWKNGVNAYFQKNYTLAYPAFQTAGQANRDFQAAKDFAARSLSVAPAGGSASSGGSNHNDGSNGKDSIFGKDSIKIGSLDIPYWALSIAGLVLLVVILLLTSLIVGRARAEHRRALQAELAEAERRATIEARHIAEIEAAQRAWAQQSQSPQPLQQSPVLQPQSVPRLDLRCPRCGEPVAQDANYCSNCRLVLSPSESGLHLRVRPQTSIGAGAAASASSVVPTRSIADQPTLPPPPPPPTTPSRSLAEQPTLEIVTEDTARAEMEKTAPRAAQADMQKTVPYSMQQLQGSRLGFVAGTRSDPGKKRKYKPNEDSLFAAQGLANAASSPQPFGLFVVADGMGGHAKGQDASRLAIQMIIEYILPRLMNNGVSHHEGYAQLLVEGIQNANQSVHQHNMEQRGDMGTTVTAALVVDTVAYVANVGDSRTYLYRESEGLKKITNDHSVVASLVEAGIIKPDDIYTHPKRNQIYRSLGEKAMVEIDAFTVQLQEGDKLLLCSDGLWDMVRDPKIEEVIKRPAPDPTAIGEELIQAALDGGGDDNVSVIVVHITDAARADGLPRIQLLAKPDSVEMPQV